MITAPDVHEIDAEGVRFYRDALETLNAVGVEYMVGGTFSLQPYTGLVRDTKDFDIFLRAEALDRALDALAEAGYRTEIPFPHWLAKAYDGDTFVDLIFSSGNGIARVDDEWFAHAPESTVLGMSVLLCPPEETIWSKAFIMERERYDGADVAHLLRCSGTTLDWNRLLRRFEGFDRVLLSHLTLFGFIYPHERNIVPNWVMFKLMRSLLRELETDPTEELVCRGTYLSRSQCLPDLEEWGYQDARVLSDGTMTEEQTDIWTQAALEQAEVR